MNKFWTNWKKIHEYKQMESIWSLIILTMVLLTIALFNTTLFRAPPHEYFGSGPEIFLEEGYGSTAITDNNYLAPVYTQFNLPTIFDQ